MNFATHFFPVLLVFTQSILAAHSGLPVGESTFTTLPEGPLECFVAKRGEGAPALVGDGVADDTAALRALVTASRAVKQQVIFLPAGRYRVTDTVVLPKGFRLIGYGAARPVIVLAKETTGWGADAPRRSLVHFATQEGLRDGKPFLGNDTFFSGLINVNLEIGTENPAACGLDYSVAQGTILQDVDIRAAADTVCVHRLGNEVVRCRFFGGDYACLGDSVTWQTTFVDCMFEGQTKAALEVSNCGPTLVRCVFRDMPVALRVRPRGGDTFHAEECRFENIRDVVADFNESTVSLLSIERGVFVHVPQLFRASNVTQAGIEAESWILRRFLYGAQVEASKKGVSVCKNLTVVDGMEPLAQLPSLPESDLPALPLVAEWRNVRSLQLGSETTPLRVIGDGIADDTAALQAAIERQRVIFLPPGKYRLTDTLRLRAETAFTGLSPLLTRFVVKDNTAAFSDAKHPRPVVETDAGGAAQFSGIGIEPGDNPGVFALRWQAGATSYLNDLWVHWGESHHRPRKAATLQITGGGIFRNLWIATHHASLGLQIHDTTAPGRLYGASIEHHLSGEVLIERTCGWTFHALQTESNKPDITPLAIADAQDLRFANLYLYATGNPRPTAPAVTLARSTNLYFGPVRSYSYGKGPPECTFILNGTETSVKQQWMAELRIPAAE